jgi:hypothetical protein
VDYTDCADYPQLDLIVVKGKTKPIQMYEIFNADKERDNAGAK